MENLRCRGKDEGRTVIPRGPFTKTVNPYADLTNAGSPIDTLDTIKELAKGKDGQKIPSMKEIYDVIPRHCFERSICRASLNLIRDIMYLGICAYIFSHIWVTLGGYFLPFDIALWLAYGLVQGTIATGLWVVGHECGHGAFSPWSKVNSVVGYIVHTALLVPYFSWKYSHGKHHSYTNHLTWGETHVPATLTEASLGLKNARKWLGDDGFAIYEVIAHLVLGWPLYLFVNATGGRRDYTGKAYEHTASGRALGVIDKYENDGELQKPSKRDTQITSSKNHQKTKEIIESLPYEINQSREPYYEEIVDFQKEADAFARYEPVFSKINHFIGYNSILFPKDIQFYITLSGLGCLGMIGLLIALGIKYSFTFVFCWYVLPALVVNGYLVLYTWLQHTHPNIPHYGDDSFTFLRGALSTLDRPYPWIIDELHHHIGTSHVLHHIDAKIPHYHALEATRCIKPLLGSLYREDNTGILKASWMASKTCHYVDSLTSVQYYKNLFDYKVLLDDQDLQFNPNHIYKKTSSISEEISTDTDTSESPAYSANNHQFSNQENEASSNESKLD